VISAGRDVIGHPNWHTFLRSMPDIALVGPPANQVVPDTSFVFAQLGEERNGVFYSADD